MADLSIQTFALVDDAAPTLVFSGVGVLNFYGVNANVRISGASGALVPCPLELEVFEATDVYLSYSEAGSNPPRDVTVMARPKPMASAALTISCS